MVSKTQRERQWQHDVFLKEKLHQQASTPVVCAVGVDAIVPRTGINVEAFPFFVKRPFYQVSAMVEKRRDSLLHKS